MVAFAIYLILWSIHYYINKPTNFENLCHEKRSLRKLVFGKQFTVNLVFRMSKKLDKKYIAHSELLTKDEFPKAPFIMT